MKKRISLIFSLLLIGFFMGGAQSPVSLVNDPAMLALSEANWASQLAALAQQQNQLREQLTQAKEQKSLLKQGLESVQKVNEKLKKVDKTRKMAESQVHLLGYLGQELKSVKPSTFYDKQRYDNYVNLLNYSVDRTMSLGTMAKDLLTDGLLNMSDAERLKEIDKITEESNNLKAIVEVEKELSIREKEAFDKLMNAIKN